MDRFRIALGKRPPKDKSKPKKLKPKKIEEEVKVHLNPIQGVTGIWVSSPYTYTRF